MFLLVENVFEHDDCGDGKSCGCLPPCKEMMYNLHVSYMKYPSDKAAEKLALLRKTDIDYMR